MRQKLIVAGAAALMVGAAATHVVEVFLPSPASDAVIAGMSENERVHCMAHWDTCQAVVAAMVRDAHEVERSAAAAALRQQQCDARLAAMNKADSLQHAQAEDMLFAQYGIDHSALGGADCDMLDYLSSLQGTTTVSKKTAPKSIN